MGRPWATQKAFGEAVELNGHLWSTRKRMQPIGLMVTEATGADQLNQQSRLKPVSARDRSTVDALTYPSLDAV
jgi:hypothetical protein